MTYQWPDDFWNHQNRACEQVRQAIGLGVRRMILTAPCGTGKSRIMVALTEYGSSEWWQSIIYSHRRMLLAQTSSVLSKHGVAHGFRAAGFPVALLRPVQLAMSQTEASAVLKRNKRPIHDAQLVLSDEIHAQGGDTLLELHKRHHEAGAVIIGVTATPIDLTGEWDKLIVACTTSEGRECGALVPAITYCPDEPDMAHIKNYRVGEDLTDKQNEKAMMRPGVFGRVFTHYEKLNPKHKPTILFAPDVAGSIYFAEQFHKQGIRAAHIDAKQIWYNGEYLPSDDETREWLLRSFESGEVQMLSNRFVLREGIDLPCVAHAIFACVVGSLKSWLQMAGRAIRHHPDTPTICIQDHGANFRRHCDPNDDIDWQLGMSGYKITGLHQEAMRERPELEPITCPKCGASRYSGASCQQCGFTYNKRSKLVVQIKGQLKRVEGPAYKPHRIRMEPDSAAKWERMIYRARSEKWDATFNQAAAKYMLENNFFYPPRDLPMMPYDPGDWFEKVSDVWPRKSPFPEDRLRTK